MFPHNVKSYSYYHHYKPVFHNKPYFKLPSIYKSRTFGCAYLCTIIGLSSCYEIEKKSAVFPSSTAQRCWPSRCKYICLLPFVLMHASYTSQRTADGLCPVEKLQCTDFQCYVFLEIWGQMLNMLSTCFAPWRFKLRLPSQFGYLTHARIHGS